MKPSFPPELWREVRAVMNDAFRSSFHFAVASVGPDGSPHVTPIGSILLGEPGKAVFFEIFTSRLPRNLRHDARICILGVSSGRGFWLGSLLRGKFPRPPGVRLAARVVGERRPPTERELSLWRKRLSALRWTRGYGLLWKRLDHVRDIEIDGVEWIRMGKMTPGTAQPPSV